MKHFYNKSKVVIKRIIAVLLIAGSIINLIPQDVYAADFPEDIYFYDDEDFGNSEYIIPDKWKGLEYALFTSSDSGQSFYVNQTTIKGSVHTNGSFIFCGSKVSVDGKLEASGVSEA